MYQQCASKIIYEMQLMFNHLSANTTIVVVVNLFDQQVKSLSLGMKCVFKHQDLQMFGVKLNKHDNLLKYWVAVATHKFRWVKIEFQVGEN